MSYELNLETVNINNNSKRKKAKQDYICGGGGVLGDK